MTPTLTLTDPLRLRPDTLVRTNPVDAGGHYDQHADHHRTAGPTVDHVKLTASGLPSGATRSTPAGQQLAWWSRAMPLSFTGTLGRLRGAPVAPSDVSRLPSTTSSSCTTGTVTTRDGDADADSHDRLSSPSRPRPRTRLSHTRLTTYTPITIDGGINGDYVRATASGLPSGATYNAPSSNCLVVASNARRSFTGTSVTAATTGGGFTITAPVHLVGMHSRWCDRSSTPDGLVHADVSRLVPVQQANWRSRPSHRPQV